MSDLPEGDIPQTTTPPNNTLTPPRSPPSADAIESELKLSRKREREVSVEPVTTPSATNDTDPLLRGRKDTAIPLKKNRRHLDPTEEEEDGGSGSGSGSPPTPAALASPRQEMKRKVRQISRGVEDINWKNKKLNASEKDVELDADIDVVAPKLSSRQEHAAQVASQQSIDQDIEIAEEDSPPKTPEDSALSQSVQDVKSQDATMATEAPSSQESNHLSAGSTENNDKGLKRKFLERGTSHGPPENGESTNHVSEPLKRPRDESDKDDNPRESKRPTPPPSPPRPSPPSPKVPKKSGFMAYASTSSPFASVKGQNLFVSGKGTNTPPASSSPATSTMSTPAIESTSTFGQTSSSAVASAVPSLSAVSTATPAKRTGFEAFASSSSPFASAAARSHSPVLGSVSKLGANALSTPHKTSSALNSNPNPFASYAGPSHGFGLPLQKKARAGSPDGSGRSSLERTGSAGIFGGSGDSGKGSDDGDEEEQEDGGATTFGERLRASKNGAEEGKWDEDNKVQLEEQDVMTGEEEEETLHQVRGKLFSLHENSWKERGTGLLKLNVKVVDGTGARLIMRKDAVHTLLLNITLFPGMRCSLAQDPRYIRFSAIENGNATTYNLKVSNAKIAADLLEEINANIPS
ncbi:Brefeldin A resistance protein [Psilocybe cubensis]|uniref:Brefeldin A resistance protein n=2 Tax=Psilocybe cubensis TaxID=181762 RepID=A0ACB8GUI4_PSICU|nr:Brefeldin A resistance protein [Psilocybe cubensis]KAH9479236.1 Brefeldin A resistance protein [Psilocybe cubensis]